MEEGGCVIALMVSVLYQTSHQFHPAAGGSELKTRKPRESSRQMGASFLPVAPSPPYKRLMSCRIPPYMDKNSIKSNLPEPLDTLGKRRIIASTVRKKGSGFLKAKTLKNE
jgi:hypothetical protein